METHQWCAENLVCYTPRFLKCSLCMNRMKNNQKESGCALMKESGIVKKTMKTSWRKNVF